MADVYATTNTVLNYSGLLFDTGDNETPLLNAFSRKSVNHDRFAITVDYASGAASQPAISEKASLTAPDAAIVTRAQTYNVTQIFHKATGVSYKKLSNMGAMSGLNIADQSAAIQNELDFQVGVKMQEMRNDVEYTIINGTYAESTSDETPNKTRGLLEAVHDNNIIAVADKKELTPDIVGDLIQKIYDANGSTSGLVLVVSAIQKRQLSKYFSKENGFLLPNSRTVGGVAIDEIVTDFGTVGVMLHKKMPNGTVLMMNPSVCQLVEQPVPGKGNFFYEELARTGAGIKGQLFGQLGLDHGPSWFHAKATGLATAYTPKSYID